MNKTKTIFITDFVVALILLIIFGRFSYFFGCGSNCMIAIMN
jgi:hypothetical protein